MSLPPPHKNLLAHQSYLRVLATQREHLLLIRKRQLMWMSESNDAQLCDDYRQIADLLQQTAHLYDQLIDELQTD